MFYLLVVLSLTLLLNFSYAKYKVEFKENFSGETHIFYIRAWSASSAIMKVGSTVGFTPIIERVWLPAFLLRNKSV